MSEKPISPLRQRMLEDMSMRRFVPDTQREYIRAVKRLATFLGRSPDTATPEELRAFQLHLTETGVQPPTIHATVAAQAVSPFDAGETSGGTRSGQAAVPRLTRASGRCEDIRGVPRSTQEEALVRLRQAAVRRPESRARLSVTVYAPRRHLEPSPDRSRRAERHVQGQGLQDRRPRPVHDDDARRRRVHPPVPHPRAAQRLPSHPPLRLVRQRESRRDDRASARILGTGNACGRRENRSRPGGGAGTRPALPLLWRPHVRHRDLRCRLPTTLPADGNEDRYLMSETATFRTRTTKGFPRWSMTRYAAARPNTCLALHSAPRASPKRIVNAQSKPISQTGGHNNVTPEPRRLPHTHIRPIKSP